MTSDRAQTALLNADKVDGASIVSNRIISTTGGDHILQVPGLGDFNVMPATTRTPASSGTRVARSRMSPGATTSTTTTS
jgi:hypothetical protein